MSEYETTSITIREDQAEWFENKHLNKSAFIRSKIDEEMDK